MLCKNEKRLCLHETLHLFNILGALNHTSSLQPKPREEWRSGRESAAGCFLNCTIVMRLWFRGCEWPETAHSGSLTGRGGGLGVPLRGCSASELLPLSRLPAAAAVREKPRGECKQT